MSRDKQIEEMAKDLCRLDRECDICPFRKRAIECNPQRNAKRAIDKGYRKASEIFEEIDKVLNFYKKNNPFNDLLKCVIDKIAELKKKYTESEKDDGKV